MVQIIQNVQFKNVKCQFQKELNEDIKSIKNENRLFVKADKSTNYYKLDTTKYNQLLNDNITKTYKKADKNQLNKIDAEAKAITKKLGIDNRVEMTARKEAFVTLKDHKDNFANKPTCRLTERRRKTKHLYHCLIQECAHDGFQSQRGCRIHVNTKHSWFSYFDEMAELKVPNNSPVTTSEGDPPNVAAKHAAGVLPSFSNFWPNWRSIIYKMVNWEWRQLQERSHSSTSS